MFTADAIMSVARGVASQDVKDAFLRVKNLISNTRSDGGSRLLRHFLRAVELNHSVKVTRAQALYIANESNYLVRRYGSVAESDTVKAKAMPATVLNEVVSHNAKGALDDDPQHWIQSTLKYARTSGNSLLHGLTASDVEFILVTEGGLKGGRIVVTAESPIHYYGPFQIGGPAWQTGIMGNRWLSTLPYKPVPSTALEKACRLKQLGGPGDLVVTCPIWVHFIGASLSGVRMSLTDNLDLRYLIYSTHNLGPASVSSFLAKKPTAFARWAILTQMGFTQRPGHYVVDARRAINAARSNSNNAGRSLFHILRLTTPNARENFIREQIAALKNHKYGRYIV